MTAIVGSVILSPEPAFAANNQFAFLQDFRNCGINFCEIRHQLWKATATGDQLLVDGVNPTTAALSPDGQEIAYISQDGKDLMLIDVDGQESRLVYHESAAGTSPSTSLWEANFSPDGRSLVFGRSAPDTKGIDLYTIRKDGTGLTRLTHLKGNEDNASFSPDGSRITYDTGCCNVTPGSPQIVVMDSNGKHAKKITKRTPTLPDAQHPSFSPDGRQIVFDRSYCALGPCTSRLWIAQNTKGSHWALSQLTADQSPDSSLEPQWLSDGSVAFLGARGGQFGQSGVYTVNPNDHSEAFVHTSAPSPGGIFRFSYPKVRLPINSGEANSLLQRYSPLLRYDSQETYFADSAGEMTDNNVPGVCANQLKRGDVVLASADPTAGFANLSLGFLGYPNYANGTGADSGDAINACNTYQSDAQRLHANPIYADRVDGHATQDSDGKWWLEYWFFEYYNPENLAGAGTHEGDWEMIEIGLDLYGAPDVATYAQHDGGETCNWGHVPKAFSSSNDVTPVVYVATGSHASYFTAGTHDRGPLPADQSNGLGPAVRPSLTPISDSSPSWVAWPGKWGGSGASPRGPSHQSKWSTPGAFSASGQGCTVAISGQAASLRAMRPSALSATPPAPKLSAQRIGDQAVVAYHVPDAAGKQQRAAHILITVHSATKTLEPSGRAYRVEGKSGSESIRLPLGPGPYTVRASTFSRKGLRSSVVSTALK